MRDVSSAVLFLLGVVPAIFVFVAGMGAMCQRF